MPLSPDFTAYALELLAGFGRLEAKRMFGGAGLYRNGVMFGILDDDVIFFRVDDALQEDLKAQGSVPWVYSMKRDGAVREMGYWRMPETAADDPDEAVAIAKRAYAAALARQEKRAAKAVAKKAPAKKKVAKTAAKSAAKAKAKTKPKAKK